MSHGSIDLQKGGKIEITCLRKFISLSSKLFKSKLMTIYYYENKFYIKITQSMGETK